MATHPKFKAASPEKSVAAAGRVVRAEDWSATADRGMSAFSYTPFSMRGKPATEVAVGTEESIAVTKLAQQRQREEQAQKLLAAERQAHADALQRNLAQGLEQGRQEGERVARASYDASLAALQTEVEAALRALREDKVAAFMEFESHAAGVLAFALRRVFGELAGNFSEAVLPLIREAIGSLGQNATLIVKVNPADLSLVEEKRGFWQRLDLPGDDVRCVTDSRVPQGGCLVVADATTARVDLESLGGRFAEAVEAACAERLRLLARPEGGTTSAGV